MKKNLPYFLLLLAIIFIGVILYNQFFSRMVFNRTGENNSIEESNSISPVSSADLSYLFIVGDNGVKIELTNTDGNVLEKSYTQQPLSNDMTGETAGSPTQQIDFSKPTSGKYKISAKSGSNYKIDIFAYDKNGNPAMASFTGRGNNIYIIDFDKENYQRTIIRQQ